MNSSAEAAHAVEVQVKTQYLANQSVPLDHRFVFTYTITLINHSAEPVQLISRHWIITDANQKVMEVRGYGVVGQQPLLAPGESYQYSSGTMLETETGTMTGSYQMQNAEGEFFDTPIPTFALVPPHLLN